MNGFIKKTVAILSLVGGMAIFCGCHSVRESGLQSHYYNLVDPCWPQRYNATAAKSVNQAFAGQVNNGHVLDQTIRSWMFEPGTDTLTPQGMHKLDILARRRPVPDTKIYLQTAQDVAYDPESPDTTIHKRSELDNRRIVAIQRYLGMRTAGRGLSFEVVVHDPPEVGMPANLPITGDLNFMNKSIQDHGALYEGIKARVSGGLGAGGG